jgi:catechol 2,3-dioxygenase-like lactoylglutathione lyase family enzyme
MGFQINGIQQIGIGVPNAIEAYNWYSKVFGFDILVFEDIAKANLMLRYTGNELQERHAILVMHLQGGGGLEIWQNKTHTPVPAVNTIQFGDIGIFAIKIRTQNITTTYKYFQSLQIKIIGSPCINANGILHFFIQDIYENYFEIIEDPYVYIPDNKNTGGVLGAVIGVSDMDKAIAFYKNVLLFDQVIVDTTTTLDGWQHLPNGSQLFRTVLLGKSINNTGAFGALLGPVQIELVQAVNTKPTIIFANRHWGDWGFIHICFDINGMQDFAKNCDEQQYPFTVNSISGFNMGKASGHFAYNEDPDGTLIEYVETHKVPIVKKLGIYYTIKKGKGYKNLPVWFIKLFKFARVQVKKR